MTRMTEEQKQIQNQIKGAVGPLLELNERILTLIGMVYEEFCETKTTVGHLQETIKSMEDETESFRAQLVQARKDNQLLRSQVSQLTKKQHHNDQSMY